MSFAFDVLMGTINKYNEGEFNDIAYSYPTHVRLVDTLPPSIVELELLECKEWSYEHQLDLAKNLSRFPTMKRMKVELWDHDVELEDSEMFRSLCEEAGNMLEMSSPSQ